MSNFLQNALRNKILWYMASRYLTFAMQFVSSMYIAVKMGAYYWGIWSFILLLVNMGTLLNWGIGNSINILLVQHKTEKDLCTKYCYNGFLLSCLIMIPAALFTAYERLIGIPYFAKYHIGNYIYAILLIVCISYLNSYLINVFRVKNRLFAVAFSQSAFPAASFLLMFFATGENLLALLTAGYLAAVSISLVLFLCGKYIDWKQKADCSMMREIFLKGFFLFCYNASFLLIVLSTKTIISYYYPVKMFGYFAFAFNLANAAMLLVDSFTFVAFPKMLDMLRDRNVAVEKVEFLRKCYLLCISGIVYAAIPGCWLLLRFMPAYQTSFESFIVIILALAVYPLCYGYNTYMLAQDKEKTMACLVILAVLLNILMTYTAAGVLHVKMEYCADGIMAAYGCFAILVDISARRNLRQRNTFRTVLKLLPLYWITPFAVALFLVFGNFLEPWLLWFPLVVFLLFASKQLAFLCKTMMRMIKSPDLLNVN